MSDDYVKAYLVVPENFEELAEKTGVSVEWLQNAYDYDQQFVEVTKIYVVPKKNPTIIAVGEMLDEYRRGLLSYDQTRGAIMSIILQDGLT